MFVIHFKLHKRALLAALSILVMVVVLTLLLPGCRKDDTAPIPAATEEQRLAYLTQLGWTVDPTPVETLDLQLPQPLTEEWEAYAQLQSEQNLPFAEFAGQPVRRFTYTLTNYPGMEKGVQLNLYICDDRLIGGDVIALGENGFQSGLSFPET